MTDSAGTAAPRTRSRARVVTLLILVALVMLVPWIASHTYWDTTELPLPPRGEAATNPFYAAQHLAEALGARVSRIRVLSALPPDAVLVASSWHWSLTASRRERLEEWVEEGGRLVVDRSLLGAAEEFEDWSGIRRVSRAGDAAAAGGRPSRFIDPCRTLHEETVEAPSPGGYGRPLDVCGFEDTSALVSGRINDWALRDAQSRVEVLRVRVGSGSVTVINARTPWYERKLLHVDQAALFVAATELRRGDEVYFLTEDDQPSLLVLLWRFAAPALMLALGCLALMLWRGGVRFGRVSPPPDIARRSLAEQIIGTGRFVLRFGGAPSLHAAAVRALGEEAERHLPSYSRLSQAERLAALARLTGYRAELLRAAIDLVNPNRPGELAGAVGLVESARRHLASIKKGR